MDNYNPKQVLTELFQMILSGIEIDDEIIDIIEQFFIEILDSNDNSIFNNEQLYNLLFLLEFNDIETPLLKFLIYELKIKGLRVSTLKEYNRSLEQTEKNKKVNNSISNTKINQCEKKMVQQKPQNLEVGLDIVPISRILKNNLKLTEDEL